MSKSFAFSALDWPTTEPHPCLQEQTLLQNRSVDLTPGADAVEEAELAMRLILMAGQKNMSGAGERHKDWWNNATVDDTPVLNGKTVGLVGYTPASRMLARRAHFGFGMKATFFDDTGLPPEILSETSATQSSLEELLAESDVVSMHLSGANRRHVLNGPKLDLMRPSALLINATGGNQINPLALSNMLMFDLIAGAGLVVETDGTRCDTTLTQCPTVVTVGRDTSTRPQHIQ
ncbi:MAG: NAD(P)-dependent oxidoreductase [Pseudomonadota bacterium]